MTPQKKELIKKVLEALIPYRNMAEWFLIILQNEWNNEIKETLFENIINEIKNINNENDRNKIKSTLEKIKEQENKEKEEEWKYLDELINNI